MFCQAEDADQEIKLLWPQTGHVDAWSTLPCQLAHHFKDPVCWVVLSLCFFSRTAGNAAISASDTPATSSLYSLDLLCLIPFWSLPSESRELEANRILASSNCTTQATGLECRTHFTIDRMQDQLPGLFWI